MKWWVEGVGGTILLIGPVEIEMDFVIFPSNLGDVDLVNDDAV